MAEKLDPRDRPQNPDTFNPLRERWPRPAPPTMPAPPRRMPDTPVRTPVGPGPRK